MKVARTLGLRGVLVASALAALVFCASCVHQGDSVVLSADGSKLSSEQIDADPVALLPSGALGVGYVDAQKAITSEFGGAVAGLAGALLAIGPESKFDVRRDLKKIYAGAYSIEGADVSVLVQGDFDPSAIALSVEHKAPTITGAPIAKLPYAGNTVYVSNGTAFSVLTNHTIVAGTETGVHRVLDKIRDNRLKRELPDWVCQLMQHPEASVVVAADMTDQAAASAVAGKLPSMGRLKTVRILGNFAPPGINVAGAMTYPDADSAASATTSLQQLAQLTTASMLMSVLGASTPVRGLQVRQVQNDVQFVAAIDSKAVSMMLGMASRAIGMPASR